MHLGWLRTYLPAYLMGRDGNRGEMHLPTGVHAADLPCLTRLAVRPPPPDPSRYLNSGQQ